MRMSAHIMNLDANVNRRRTVRRSLVLNAVAHQGDVAAADISILNLSQTGMQIETQSAFEVGEIFYLHLPEIGATPAQIRWNDKDRYGCEFLAPVGKAVISAALLKSTFELPEDEIQAAADERLAASRFFGDQVLPANQNATPLLYVMSSIFTMLVVAVAAMMANGDLIIN
jgi:hypothetical protein